MVNIKTALSFVSERLIQDFQPGDARFTKNFGLYPGGSIVNVRSRGIQFGTRYIPTYIENGGSFATIEQMGYCPIAPTYEENALMIAEADIYLGSISQGTLHHRPGQGLSECRSATCRQPRPYPGLRRRPVTQRKTHRPL
jgi:hypothetical protein